MTQFGRRVVITAMAFAAVLVLGSAPGHAQTAQIFVRTADAPDAPFGDAVSSAINNYTRAAPYLGTAGLLGEGGVAEAAQLGFKTIIDLRSPAEPNQPAEAGLAADAGLGYINIPIAKGAPTEEQIALFTDLMEDRKTFPILLHCASANRAGALWALYRASNGVPADTAIEEGRAIGMKSREGQVRELLGLPPL